MCRSATPHAKNQPRLCSVFTHCHMSSFSCQLFHNFHGLDEPRLFGLLQKVQSFQLKLVEASAEAKHGCDAVHLRIPN